MAIALAAHVLYKRGCKRNFSRNWASRPSCSKPSSAWALKRRRRFSPRRSRILLEGADVVGQSQTGSGKTAAFALPAIEKVDRSVARAAGADSLPDARTRGAGGGGSREARRSSSAACASCRSTAGKATSASSAGCSAARRSSSARRAGSWITSSAARCKLDADAAWSSSMRRIACSTWASAKTSRRSSQQAPAGAADGLLLRHDAAADPAAHQEVHARPGERAHRGAGDRPCRRSSSLITKWIAARSSRCSAA